QSPSNAATLRQHRFRAPARGSPLRLSPYRGTRRRGGSGASADDDGGPPPGPFAVAEGARCGCAQPVSHRSHTGCTSGWRPGPSATIQPVKIRFSLPSNRISSTSTNVDVRGGSLGSRVKQARGVILRVRNVSVLLSPTASGLTSAVTLSSAANVAVVF